MSLEEINYHRLNYTLGNAWVENRERMPLS